MLSQVSIAVAISCLLHLRSAVGKTALTVYATPVIARMCGFPLASLTVVHNFACSFTMMLLGFYVLNLSSSILLMMRRCMTHLRLQCQSHGLTGTFMITCKRLNLSAQFAIFWIVLCCSNIYVLYTSNNGVTMGNRHRYFIPLVAFSESCSTPVVKTLYLIYIQLI